MPTLMPLSYPGFYTRFKSPAGDSIPGIANEGFYANDTGAIGKYIVAHGDYAEHGQFSGAGPAVYEEGLWRCARTNRTALFCARLVRAKHLPAIWAE